MKTRIIQNTTTQRLLAGCMSLLLTASALAAPEFTPDSQPTGWISRPVVTFFDLSSGEEAFYQIDFRKNTWSGNVLARDINSTARIQTTGPWDDADPTLVTAASMLDNLNYNTGRKIATTGSPFRWAYMTEAERTALGSEDILNYVRGDRSNEEPVGLSLRHRESVLGDIQHSNIYYWDDKVNQTLFVGANDGMLHAFNANTGAENFAYIPSMLIAKLDKLTAKPYVHTHFVDGPISIANMEVSDTTKAILVGGLGAGGAGLYALDVTKPTADNETEAAGKVLWEISAATEFFEDLGHTYGTPMFTKLTDGTAAVIVGNGYANTGSGHAVLYVINANTGALINAIDTFDSGGSGSTTSPNGLSSPTLYDVDGDFVHEYAYAGDIDGNMWKFDLANNTSSLLFTTSPVQAITSAPAVHSHPLGGQMVAFATGRILTSGDQADTSVHYVYGIWDGAPDANNKLLVQTLSSSTYGAGAVRTVTGNIPNWTSGSGHHMGWRVALPSGERVVGEKPFYNNGRFYFLSTNPSLESVENWLHELVFNTGGAPLGPIYDLNQDGKFNKSDYASNGQIPVAKYLGNGVFSQPLLVKAEGLSTTLYAFHPDLPYGDGVPTPPDDPGVSGGHFDFDIYYYEADQEKLIPTSVTQTKTFCIDKRDVEKEYYEISQICIENFDAGYEFLAEYSQSTQKCLDKIKYVDVTCSTVTTELGPYGNQKHVHEYDDKYDVTGVNMLNASLIDFNLSNAIADPATPFKILVMNQYLNPAAKLSVGGATYENVETFGNLASETSASSLLAGLKTYTQTKTDLNYIDTLIVNLPLDAFKSKDDWWSVTGETRAGLIPTQTGCVNKVDDEGLIETPGLRGERFNGALTIQLIRPETPPGQLELNGPDVTYGWRVRQSKFSDYVLAEYTMFWHHPNGACYGDDDWIPDPPEDFDADSRIKEAAQGSADPKDGVFGGGLAIVGSEVTVDGLVTTTTVTYADGTKYVKTETRKDDGSTVIHSVFRDGDEETVTIYTGDGGKAGFIDPNTGSPEEELSTGVRGRQSWRETND